MNQAETRGFFKGVAFATAWLVTVRDEPLFAAEILKAADCDLSAVDELDIQELAPLLDEQALPEAIKRTLEKRLAELEASQRDTVTIV